MVEPYLPVGLGSLAATLRCSSHQVKIVDAMNEGWSSRGRIESDLIEIGINEEEIAWRIRRLHPHVVGFSVPFTTQMPRLRSMARWVKAIHPEIMVVCGGNHPTANPKEVAQIPDIDLVFLGEGETNLLKFLGNLERGFDSDNLDGVAYRDAAGKIVIKPNRVSIKDTDQLSWPAYDILPLKKYFKAVGRRRIPFFFSRGCERSCSYCSNRKMFGKNVRYFSVDYCLEHMRYLVEYYGTRDFIFYDDNLFADCGYAYDFFDQLLVQKFKVQWQASSGNEPANLDEKLLDKMRRSGGRRLHFAPDSGSRKVLKHLLHKSLDLYEFERAIQRSLKAGFKVSCHFTLGNPGETLEEVYDTLNFAWKLRRYGVDEIHFSLATPFPGTDLHSQAERKGSIIDRPEPMITPYEGCLSTAEIPVDEIVKIRDTADREFNSRGLVMNLTRHVISTRKAIQPVEERFFSSMAPQPHNVETPDIQEEQFVLTEEAI